MKVIEHGQGNRVKCPSCDSVLEFEPSDVARKQTGIYHDEGELIFSYSIQCSACRHSVAISYMNPAMLSRVDQIHKDRAKFDSDL